MINYFNALYKNLIIKKLNMKSSPLNISKMGITNRKVKFNARMPLNSWPLFSLILIIKYWPCFCIIQTKVKKKSLPSISTFMGIRNNKMNSFYFNAHKSLETGISYIYVHSFASN